MTRHNGRDLGSSPPIRRFGSEGGLIVGWVVRDATQGLCDSQRCLTSLSLEEPLLGNGSYAHVRAAGRPARRHCGGVGDWPGWLRIAITTSPERASCCGRAAWRHGTREVVLVDLPVFGRPARLVWCKQRWKCLVCGRAWSEQDSQIVSSRCALTTRAARWATLQVGRHGRSVQEVADDLGCDWHTVMDAVELYGTPLIDDPGRFGTVTALGLDETLFCRQGRFRVQCWSTQIVDVRRGQLLDVVEGRDSTVPCRWLAGRSDEWRAAVEWTTLDLSTSCDSDTRIGRCSTRCCPTRCRSLTRSMS